MVQQYNDTCNYTKQVNTKTSQKVKGKKNENHTHSQIQKYVKVLNNPT